MTKGQQRINSLEKYMYSNSYIWEAKTKEWQQILESIFIWSMIIKTRSRQRVGRFLLFQHPAFKKHSRCIRPLNVMPGDLMPFQEITLPPPAHDINNYLLATLSLINWKKGEKSARVDINLCEFFPQVAMCKRDQCIPKAN